MKKAVITAVFSNTFENYDLPYVKDKIKGWDYLLFTNIPQLINNIGDGWTKIDFDLRDNHPIYTAKYCKWMCHKILPNYDYIIWVDGFCSPNVKYNWDMIANKTTDITMKKHSHNNCIYKECKNIYLSKKDTYQNMGIIYNFLKSKKMPPKNGLYETGILLRNLRNNKVNKMAEELYDLLLKYTYRDQAFLTYVFWKNNFKVKNIIAESSYVRSGNKGVHKYV